MSIEPHIPNIPQSQVDTKHAKAVEGVRSPAHMQEAASTACQPIAHKEMTGTVVANPVEMMNHLLILQERYAYLKATEPYVYPKVFGEARHAQTLENQAEWKEKIGEIEKQIKQISKSLEQQIKALDNKIKSGDSSPDIRWKKALLESMLKTCEKEINPKELLTHYQAQMGLLSRQIHDLLPAQTDPLRTLLPSEDDKLLRDAKLKELKAMVMTLGKNIDDLTELSDARLRLLKEASELVRKIESSYMRSPSSNVEPPIKGGLVRNVEGSVAVALAAKQWLSTEVEKLKPKPSAEVQTPNEMREKLIKLQNELERVENRPSFLTRVAFAIFGRGPHIPATSGEKKSAHQIKEEIATIKKELETHVDSLNSKIHFNERYRHESDPETAERMRSETTQLEKLRDEYQAILNNFTKEKLIPLQREAYQGQVVQLEKQLSSLEQRLQDLSNKEALNEKQIANIKTRFDELERLPDTPENAKLFEAIYQEAETCGKERKRLKEEMQNVQKSLGKLIPQFAAIQAATTYSGRAVGDRLPVKRLEMSINRLEMQQAKIEKNLEVLKKVKPMTSNEGAITRFYRNLVSIELTNEKETLNKIKAKQLKTGPFDDWSELYEGIEMHIAKAFDLYKKSGGNVDQLTLNLAAKHVEDRSSVEVEQLKAQKQAQMRASQPRKKVQPESSEKLAEDVAKQQQMSKLQPHVVPQVVRRLPLDTKAIDIQVTHLENMIKQDLYDKVDIILNKITGVPQKLNEKQKAKIAKAIDALNEKIAKLTAEQNALEKENPNASSENAKLNELKERLNGFLERLKKLE